MSKQLIEKHNSELFARLKSDFPGKFLMEIGLAGDGDSLHYVVMDSKNYDRLLWERDNKLNGDEGILGLSHTKRL